MKLLYSYIPFQILFGVVLGILYPITNIFYVWIGCSFIGIALLATLWVKIPIIKNYIVLFILVVFGFLLSSKSLLFHQPSYQKNHYLNFITSKDLLSFTLVKKIKSSSKKDRFYARLHHVNQHRTTGLVLVEFSKKDNNPNFLKSGMVLKSFAEVLPINASISPYDFNYRQYLHNKNIHAKISLKDYVLVGQDSFWWYSVQNYRDRIVEKVMDNFYLSTNVKGLLCAMLFGDRDHLSSSLRESFTNAGVVHILAISGMHIGVLYFMLFHLFSFFKVFNKGIYLQVFAVVLCLILFAVFSGLSTSVVRSVTMFSFVALSRLKKRSGLLLEPIVSSALVLLVFNPNYLFDVGFLLSYSAVISIVVFYPIMAKYCSFKNKIIKYFVDVLVVSIIAQLGVLAISLYCFHQFSFQFLVANFFAVSLLPMVLYLSILCSLKLMFVSDNIFIEQWYTIIVEMYLKSVVYLGNKDNFIMQDISISMIHVIGYYLLLFLIWSLIQSRSFVKWISVLFVVFCLQSVELYHKNNVLNKSELVIYDSFSLVITKKTGSELFVFGDVKSKQKTEMNRIKNEIDSIQYQESKVFGFKDKVFLIVDHKWSYSQLKIEDNLVLILNDNPKINLERVIKMLKPKEVVVSKHNYANNVKKWKSTCSKLQVPFYDIKKRGYYLIR